MAHVAICTLPGHGHVTPLLDVVAELTRRGHRVSVATGAGFAGRLAAVGADPIVYGDADADGHALADTLSGFSGFLPALDPVRAVLGADPPDVLAFDATMWVAGRVLAAALPCPVVQLTPCLASNEHYSLPAAVAAHVAAAAEPEPAESEEDAPRRDVVEDLRETLATAGMHGEIGELLSDADDRKLVFLPREFQPRGDTFDERHVFVGPCLGPRRRAADWTPPEGDDPLLLVSLGTSAFNDQPGFFRSCAAAFADLPWRVVMTLGDGTDPAELEPLPPNVHAHRWVPHPAVLANARAFVCPGGMGSIMESLACGTPLVVVPQHGEQEVNADRVAQLGLGVRLSRHDLTAAAIRDAVLAVAADDAIAHRVHAMSEACAAAGGHIRAADELLALVPAR